MKTTPLFALLILAATTASADEGFDPRRGRFEAARARMFADFKAIESASHLDRIRILQEAESCIQRASDRDAYRVCEDHERAQREQSNAAARARHEALRGERVAARQAIANRY